jgi:hypothetical protein
MAQQQTNRLIHYLVRDDEGPIGSAAVGASPGLGGIPIGTASRWRFACRADGHTNRLNAATTVTWCVRCDACRATEEFKADEQPHPRTRRGPVVANGRPCGC